MKLYNASRLDLPYRLRKQTPFMSYERVRDVHVIISELGTCVLNRHLLSQHLFDFYGSMYSHNYKHVGNFAPPPKKKMTPKSNLIMLYNYISKRRKKSLLVEECTPLRSK